MKLFKKTRLLAGATLMAGCLTQSLSARISVGGVSEFVRSLYVDFKTKASFKTFDYMKQYLHEKRFDEVQAYFYYALVTNASVGEVDTSGARSYKEKKRYKN